jgi:hypothetical protein
MTSMESKTFLMMSSAIAVLASIGLFISVSCAANETGAMMGNQTNQTGGNQTQQGPLEQLGEALGGVFGGGGNQSQ